MEITFYKDFFQFIEVMWSRPVFDFFQWGDVIIFFTIFVSELGIPIFFNLPNEALLLFGGSQFGPSIGFNEIRFALMAVAADVFGAGIFYFIFSIWGNKILERFGPRIGLTHSKLEKYYKFFARSGFWTTFLGRITPYIRIYTSMAAGLSLLKPEKFFSALILSSIIWVSFFSFIGFLFREEWRVAMRVIEQNSLTATIIIIALIAVITYFRLRQNKSVNSL